MGVDEMLAELRGRSETVLESGHPDPAVVSLADVFVKLDDAIRDGSDLPGPWRGTGNPVASHLMELLREACADSDDARGYMSMKTTRILADAQRSVAQLSGTTAR